MECGDNESQPVLSITTREAFNAILTLLRYSLCSVFDRYLKNCEVSERQNLSVVNIPKTNRLCLEKLLASNPRLSYIIISQFSVLCADSTAQRFALNPFLLLVDSFSTSPSRNLLRLEYSIKSKNYLRDSFRLSLSAKSGIYIPCLRFQNAIISAPLNFLRVSPFGIVYEIPPCRAPNSQ